jgi:hypothetical protein
LVRARLDTREWQEFATDLQKRSSRFPDVKRQFLLDVANFGKALVINVYENDVPSDIFYRFPTRDTGEYGQTVMANVRVGPKRSFAEIAVMSPYAAAVEDGRGPGGVPYEIIEEWANRKLGVVEPSEIRAIVGAIRTAGTLPRRLVFTALSPTTEYGRRWDQFAEARAVEMLDELFPSNASGARRAIRGLR